MRIVSEDSIKGAVIGNLTEVVVDNPLKMLEVLRKGESSRSYGSTTMNAERYDGTSATCIPCVFVENNISR